MTNPLHKLDREQRKWSELREHLDAAEWSDADMLSALESETDLVECLAELDESLLEDETQVGGLDATIVRLEARAWRHNKAIEKKRHVIKTAMETAGLKTFKSTVGTLTVSAGKPAVVVFEQSMLPDKYLTPQKPKVNKVELGKDLRDGQTVTGATLGNAATKLTIRRS